jgi:hypothetical protein
VEQPADCDIIDVVAGLRGERSVLAPAGDPAEDKLRIGLDQLLRAEPQPLHHPRPIALDKPVRSHRQPPHHLPALFALQVERNRPAIAEQRIVGNPDHSGPLDADDLRPMVGQHHRRERPGPQPGHLDDLQSGKRAWHRATLARDCKPASPR